MEPVIGEDESGRQSDPPTRIEREVSKEEERTIPESFQWKTNQILGSKTVHEVSGVDGHLEAVP